MIRLKVISLLSVIIVTSAIISSCGVSQPAHPTPEAIASAKSSHRKPTVSEALAAIREWDSSYLNDPESAKYTEISVTNLCYDTVDKKFGYKIWCYLNTKNQFGGYTGKRPACYFLSQGSNYAITVIGPDRYVPVD